MRQTVWGPLPHLKTDYDGFIFEIRHDAKVPPTEEFDPERKSGQISSNTALRYKQPCWDGPPDFRS